ncbi:hypothetical protein AWENTII_002929 [Aspergillus wentii]
MLFSQGPRRRNREKAIIITIFIICGLYFLFFAKGSSGEKHAATVPHENTAVKVESPSRDKQPGQVTAPQKTKTIQKDMVVASMKSDDTSWLFEHFPEWHKSIYVVDDKSAELTVKKNKGRESMVYLTYIIDNYHKLPETMLFIHSQRFQWHNDDPYYDGVPMLSRFQVPYLQRQGYVNLRCTWALGCPVEIHPHSDTHRENVHAGEYFKTGFMELFPGADVPEEVGVSCCAQFGVTRDKVLERSKKDYEHFREWLSETSLPDDLSGRIMEYSWHMIFGKEPVHCPKAERWIMRKPLFASTIFVITKGMAICWLEGPGTGSDQRAS